MEILRIGKQAIKVSLNEEESIKYKITASQEFDENEIKESFSLLLKEIKSKTDFTYSNKQLFTEIFPCQNGGCEIFISSVSIEKDIQKNKISVDAEQRKPTFSIYEVDDFGKLLLIAYRLNEIKHNEKSSVYYDKEKKIYHLVLENLNTKNLKYAFLLEYAKFIRGGPLSFLKEHSVCVLKRREMRLKFYQI